MWTLVVCLSMACAAIEAPSVIVVDGFSNPVDCRYLGALNVEFLNPHALYRCDKTGKPPVRCLPDKRTYGRDASCITA